MEKTGLPIVLERMHRCFWGRTQGNDLELLTTSLQQIFACADRLYHVLLPQLTFYAQEEDTAERMLAQPHDTFSHLHAHYCTWTVLQEIEDTLNQLKPLCTLLINTTIAILEALDYSSSLYSATRIKHQLLLAGEDEERTDLLAALTTAHIPGQTYFHWMQAVSILTEQLQHWQYGNQRRFNFADRFALLATMIPTLGQLDSTLDLIADSTHRIFGILLPEFHTVARGDDETAATLLLDIVQKVDQIQLFLEAQSEPLHLLTREYAHKLQREQPYADLNHNSKLLTKS